MTIESRVRKLEEAVAARPVERVGPPVWEQIQVLLADPGEVAAAMEWDNRYLGEDSADRLELAGLDEEARAVALEQGLEASAPLVPAMPHPSKLPAIPAATGRLLAC